MLTKQMKKGKGEREKRKTTNIEVKYVSNLAAVTSDRKDDLFLVLFAHSYVFALLLYSAVYTYSR